MDKTVLLFALVPIGLVLLRLAVAPLKLLAKVSLHVILGVLCLWLINSAAGFTGLRLPVNAITALLAGYLGLPGIALTALLGRL